MCGVLLAERALAKNDHLSYVYVYVCVYVYVYVYVYVCVCVCGACF